LGGGREVALHVDVAQRYRVEAVTDGERLRRELERVGLTQAQLGALMGRHRTTVADWCRGEREVPREAWITLEMYRQLGEKGRAAVWRAVARHDARQLSR
jgi:plasmid maintenance system antidote protein VapI